MKARVVNFFKRNPELLYDILEMNGDFILYDPAPRYISLVGFDDKAKDFDYVGKYKDKIKVFFKNTFKREIQINLNKVKSFEERENERILFLRNEGLKWDIKSFDGSVKWSNESKLHGPWSLRIIDEFRDKWDWSTLSRNQSLKLTEVLVEKFEDRWDWKNGLDWHVFLPKTESFQRKYWRRMNYKLTIIPYDELINEIENFDSDNLYDLSQNRWIKWTIDIIEKGFLNEEKFKTHHFALSWRALSENPSIPWDKFFLEYFKKHLRWEGLSGNTGLNWSEEFIDRYKEKWNWKILCRNKAVPWTAKLIEKYKDNIDYNELVWNESIKWNIELLESNRDKWNWETLVQMRNFPWTKLMLEKYYKNIKWTGGFYEVDRNSGYEYAIPEIFNNKTIQLDKKMAMFFKEKWKLNPLDENQLQSPDVKWQSYLGEWNYVSLNFILNIDLIEEFYEMFDKSLLLDNPSIISFRLIEIMEEKFGKEKFLEFLDEGEEIISNKQKIWQNILYYYFDEEVLEKSVGE